MQLIITLVSAILICTGLSQHPTPPSKKKNMINLQILNQTTFNMSVEKKNWGRGVHNFIIFVIIWIQNFILL